MNDLIASSAAGKPRLLYVNPTREGHSRFLPVVYAHLKTYCDSFPHLEEGIIWERPFYHIMETREDFENFIGDNSYDIVALSAYVWNLKLNEIIIEIIKRRNPNCFIVMGGPGISWYDQDVFDEWPDIDIIVKGEGELPFKQILDQYLGDKDYTNIPSIIYNENGARNETPGTYRHYPADGDKSPILHCKDYFEEELDNWVDWSQPSSQPSIVWETNKGCPYQCVFCEIATTANNKVVKYDLDRVLAEAEWIISSKLVRTFIADSNFGMLERDEYIVDKLVEFHHKHGVKYNGYSLTAAKSHGDRVGRIYLKLLEFEWGQVGRVCGQALTYDLQTQTEDSLTAMNRYIIKDEERQKVVTQQIKNGFSPVPALIIGCPGETNESWMKSVAGLPEWRMHGDWYLHPWLQLPNAPSSQPDYVAEYQIETVMRYTKNLKPAKATLLNEFMAKAPYQVANKDMTREDYGFRALYWSVLSACHTYGLAHYVAKYLRHTHGISYYDFYVDLFTAYTEGFGKEVADEVLDHFRDFMVNPDASYEMDADDEHPRLSDPEEYVFLHTTKKCLPEMYDYLRQRWAHIPNAKSVIDFQEFAMITPYRANTTGVIQHKWGKYFTELAADCYLIENKPEPDIGPVQITLQNTTEKWDQLQSYLLNGESHYPSGHVSFYIQQIFWFGGSAPNSSSYWHFKDFDEVEL